MRENKATFVKQLLGVLQQTSEYADVTDINYCDEGDREYIYVDYRSGAQRRVDVSADSCSAIMLDFLTKIGKADWVTPPKKFTADTSGDEPFFKELKDTYDVTDFSGHLGALLGSSRLHSDFADDEVDGAIDFVQNVYEIAVKYL